jgi:hypothetical protein
MLTFHEFFIFSIRMHMALWYGFECFIEGMDDTLNTFFSSTTMIDDVSGHLHVFRSYSSC